MSKNSQEVFQIILSVTACISFVVSIYFLARRQRLSFRYALGWLFLGVLGLVSIAMIPFTSQISKWLRVSPAAIVAVIAIVLLVAICVQLSISISGLQNQVRKLAEHVALIEREDISSNE